MGDTGIQAPGSDGAAVAAGDSTMWTGLLHTGLVGSFLRLPHVAPDTDALRRHGARAAIYGLPFDATNISRTGANYGPRGIREVSCQFTDLQRDARFRSGRSAATRSTAATARSRSPTRSGPSSARRPTSARFSPPARCR